MGDIGIEHGIITLVELKWRCVALSHVRHIFCKCVDLRVVLLLGSVPLYVYPRCYRPTSIFEIFQHHDAILGLANDRAKIKPEPLSWPLGQVHEILECPK